MINTDLLIKKALEAREKAYAPYSSFYVGAALLTSDGEIIGGANIENGSYGATICAERSAFSAAISSGKRSFSAIAVVGGKKDDDISDFCPPCGICRQFMAEFCSPDFKIILYNGKEEKISTLDSLLPDSFNLKER
jgi:cytidine deaminase